MESDGINAIFTVHFPVPQHRMKNGIGKGHEILIVRDPGIPAGYCATCPVGNPDKKIVSFSGPFGA